MSNTLELPVPVDDGAARHLQGTRLPSISLPSTSVGPVRLDEIPGLAVLYVYPRTAGPGEVITQSWIAIPGARGCTAESCAFRDHAAELAELGARVFGVSAQPPSEQQEAAARLHLPFPLLSDERFELARALSLPTLEFEGRVYLRRLTLVVEDGAIRHVFYPVFPPDRHAEAVIAWLREARSGSLR